MLQFIQEPNCEMSCTGLLRSVGDVDWLVDFTFVVLHARAQSHMHSSAHPYTHTQPEPQIQVCYHLVRSTPSKACHFGFSRLDTSEPAISSGITQRPSTLTLCDYKGALSPGGMCVTMLHLSNQSQKKRSSQRVSQRERAVFDRMQSLSCSGERSPAEQPLITCSHLSSH